MFVFIFAINDTFVLTLRFALLYSLQVTFTRQLISIFLSVNHILGICCGELRGNNANKNNIIYICITFILLWFFGFRVSFFRCATFCVPSATSAVELLRSPLPVACPFTVDNTHSYTSTHTLKHIHTIRAHTPTHPYTQRGIEVLFRYCVAGILRKGLAAVAAAADGAAAAAAAAAVGAAVM